MKPCNIASRPDLRYTVTCYFEGARDAKLWNFRTEGEALHFANVNNLDAARALARGETEQAAPPPAVAEKPRRTLEAAWSPAQLAGFDSGHMHDPMKGPPFRICTTTQRGYAYVVRGPVLNGKQERKFFRSQAEASTFAHMRNTEAKSQGLDSIGFPAWLRVMATRCQQQLESRGKCLEDAVRHYLDYLDRAAQSRPIGALVEDCWKPKQSAGVTKNYIQDFRRTLRRFVEFVGAETNVSEVTTEQVNQYLTSLVSYGPVSRNCIRRHICTFFSFAKAYCNRLNPAEDSIISKAVPSPVEIFTPDQLSKLLTTANPEILPFIAIGAFAGLRVAELIKLDWAQVDMAEGFIEVTAANAKSSRRRIVKILPALDAWIRPYARQSGPVYPCRGFIPVTHLRGVMRAAGLAARPRNGLRHSFASYHIALFKDAAALALEMGHTTTSLIFAGSTAVRWDRVAAAGNLPCRCRSRASSHPHSSRRRRRSLRGLQI